MRASLARLSWSQRRRRTTSAWDGRLITGRAVPPGIGHHALVGANHGGHGWSRGADNDSLDRG